MTWISAVPTSLLILLIFTAYATTSVSFQNTTSITNAPAGKWFDYVVIIMLENHSINFTYFNGGAMNSCLGNCTYFTTLANSNSFAEGFTFDHINGTSVGSYIAITSGFGNTPSECNNGPFAKGCSLLPGQNLMDRLEVAHLGWRAYIEGYPVSSGCYDTSADGPWYYVPRHNPFIYYSDIQNDATRCANLVNANSLHPQPVTTTLPRCWPIALNNDDLFFKDLNSPNGTPNYMFLVPNSIDDNHDCNDVSIGNAWLQLTIPQILNSTLFKTKRAALFITFDEQTCTLSGCPSAAPQLYTVWASNHTNAITKQGFKSIKNYTHFSALRTIEDNWMLPPIFVTTDGSASNMQEFF